LTEDRIPDSNGLFVYFDKRSSKDYITVFYPDEELIDPFKVSSLMRTCGALFGFSAGALWLSARGGFSARGSWWQRIARFLIGMVGVAILWIGLGAIIPEPENVLGYSLYYTWYAVIGFWLSALAPAIFIRLNLAQTK